MRKLSLFLIVLFFLGCGDSEFDAVGSSAGLDLSVYGRSQLSLLVGNDVVAAIDALPPTEAREVYGTIGRWDNENVTLTGTVDDAYLAVGTIVRDPELGAPSLYRILSRLSPDSGQGFIVTFGGTLDSGADTSEARAQDAYTALLSRTDVVAQNVEPLIENELPPEISSMAEFHGLRILDPAYLPTAKREAMMEIRGFVPEAERGKAVQKIIKVSDLQNYLDGTFDPEVGGSTAILDQIEFLVTPAQYIAGLRLDYPGGFQGQTQVGAIVFPQTEDFEMLVPYSPPMGGATEESYPFTGTGFTSNVQAQAIPEWLLPLGGRIPLPVGSQLFLITETGERELRATLNAQGQWSTGRQIFRTEEARTPVRRLAVYRGYPVWVSSTDSEHYWVACHGPYVPGDLLLNQRKIGRGEHLGRIQVGDKELVFTE